MSEIFNVIFDQLDKFEHRNDKIAFTVFIIPSEAKSESVVFTEKSYSQSESFRTFTHQCHISAHYQNWLVASDMSG